MVMIVNRFIGMTPQPVPSNTGGQPLPTTLLVPPGRYQLLTFEGPKVFDMTAPGLYKIWTPVDEPPGGNVSNTYNRIVAGASNAYELASAVAWLCTFGGSDQGLPVASMTEKAKNSQLHLGCGPTAIWLKSLASAIGIPCRLVHILTAETPNGYADGHQIVEMKTSGVWKVFDPSLGFVYRDHPSGNLLNLVDAVTQIQNGSAIFERIAPFNYASEVVIPHDFDEATWIEQGQIYSDAGMQAALKREMQIPAIGNDTDTVITAYMPPGTESRQSWVESLGYVVVPQATFMSMFYP